MHGDFALESSEHFYLIFSKSDLYHLQTAVAVTEKKNNIFFIKKSICHDMTVTELFAQLFFFIIHSRTNKYFMCE